MSQNKLNIGIIGAGVGGLCAARRSIEAGHSATVFEVTSNIGGTWNYTDAVGVDEFGIDIQTSMYSGLRTNLPKEIMKFLDHPFQKEIPESYIRSQDYLEYLQSFADHFDLKKHIKFNNYVIRVCPTRDSKWELYVRDLRSNEYKIYIFDAVFVCNGRYNKPDFPDMKYPGNELFKGKQLHSHDYRRPEHYNGKNVLIIGAGPSGIDLAFAISKTANKVYFSHRKHKTFELPENVERVGPVKELTENEAIFADDKKRDIDVIIYCTGYKTSFPFLSADSGICVDEDYVHPLYHHVINIQHPTMAFIGLPSVAPVAIMMDLQSRYALKMFTGERSLPSKNDMKAHSEKDAENRHAIGLPKNKYHVLTDVLDNFSVQREYFDALSSEANLPNIPKVVTEIYADSFVRRGSSPAVYRSDKYRVIDDDHFERT